MSGSHFYEWLFRARKLFGAFEKRERARTARAFVQSDQRLYNEKHVYSCETKWRLSADKKFVVLVAKSDFKSKVMGKTKAKKRSSFRNRPTGLPSVKEAVNDAQVNADVGVKTLPLVEKVILIFIILFSHTLCTVHHRLVIREKKE